MTVDTAALERAFAGKVQEVSRAVVASFNRAGAAHVRAMGRSFKPYSAGGDGIHSRSGALRRALGFAVRDAGLASELRLFVAGLRYAEIQEEGGTIRPKNKRYLTVPLPDALTPAGVLKGGARLVQRGKKYETADGVPTFVFRSKKGNLLIGTRPKNGRSKLLYTLKTQVKLDPRLGFRRTFEESTLPGLNAALERAVRA